MAEVKDLKHGKALYYAGWEKCQETKVEKFSW
jgi:hypothetical protein